MFSIGDTVFYGAHGVCIVEDIQDQNFFGNTKAYYILRSFHDTTLKLFHPVKSEDSKLTPIASKEKAELLLDTFKNPPDEWNDRATERTNNYHKIIESNNHFMIAQMVNTILRKKNELDQEGKKLASQELQILKQVTPILHKELSVSLEITVEDVANRIEEIIVKH
ncbi:CarD family transcriptional regulator [Ureibacillus acetophenoni]|uniref:CarD family transcriptional regulator n=2 Tax=Ureibacillus acetophenoni TaxID=614649 RepID=A0A285UFR6_9BACL|nr:CarD family transcriptional regulator [Ureibacillus acetophenoni]